MKIRLDMLRQYTSLPEDPHTVRCLLDETGIEVKHVEGVGEHTQFTLELLANRGDHYCYGGIAREISGRTGHSVELPEVHPLTVGDSPWPIQFESDLCLRYTITLLERDGDQSTLSKNAIQALEASGIHSVNGPVDASNLANLEFGQPTHCFDADKVDGPIVIRTSREGETAWPLFALEAVALPEGTLVIADDSKILAIAGVIGCEESKTSTDTTRILLESATFDPISVRKASHGLGIHTDSSARFERGSDPELAVTGAARVVALLEASGGFKHQGTIGVFGGWEDPKRQIALSARQAARFLDTDLSPDDITSRLTRYGFTIESGSDPDQLNVCVPPHRLWDVEFTADLYEELAKSIGYDQIPTTLPPIGLGSTPSTEERRKSIAEDVLVAHGFYEVFTDGFYSRGLRDQLGIEEGHPLWEHVETINALDRGYGLVKNNALGQAIEVVSANLRMKRAQIKGYEWTRTFHPNAASSKRSLDKHTPPCIERPLLWAIVQGTDRDESWDKCSRPADPWFLKGLVKELAVALDINLTLGSLDSKHPLHACLHPNRQCTIVRDGTVVGILGEVHPQICRTFKIKAANPCYLEVDASALLEESVHTHGEMPGKHHDIIRSVAFTLPGRLEAGSVARALQTAGPKWLTSVHISDVYAYEENGENLRGVSFSLTYLNSEGNRTTEEVNQITTTLIEQIETQFSSDHVKLR